MRYLLAVAALLLTGCATVVTPPPGPTADELDAARQQVLDASWQSTGLDGLVERPAAVPTGPGDPDAIADLFACLAAEGYEEVGVQFDDISGYSVVSGLSTLGAEGKRVKLAFYTCLAAQPNADFTGLTRRTDAQIDYLYDHYQRWTIPCMRLHDYRVDAVPTRENFHALGGNWSPYYTVPDVSTPEDHESLVDLCGRETAGLPE